jgi:uncharacterized protein (DUF169 family)
MTDYRGIEEKLRGLGLEGRPVAVAFREEPPEGVAKFTGTVPSGCSFWRLAAEGRTFYTVAADHYNCPIGSYTHNIPLPAERAPELEQTLTLMTGIGYLKMAEVPGIARLERTPGVAIYAPLGETPVDPDVVIIAAKPGQAMLVAEAAGAAGSPVAGPLLGRPTCMAIPAAIARGAVASTGCIGNRVYTDLGEDRLYVVIPGPDAAKIADQALLIASANAQLAEYHRGRRQQLATA